MKYKKLLVPLDGSKVAEAVLAYAHSLAGTLHLPVELVHVSDPETVSPSLHPSRAGDYLKQVASSWLGELSVTCAVKTGAAAEVILDTAAVDVGTLIAMATHGQTGGGRWLLGGVTQKVLQATINPLMIVRAQENDRPDKEARLETLIVPLDGSHLAEQIFPHVTYLANQLAMKVVLIRTYTLPTASYFLAAHVSPPDVAELREEAEKDAGDYLQAKIEGLRAVGLSKITPVVAEGRGPEEIIELAKKTAGGLIAMSTHGRSGMGRWVLGSVTDRVVSYCGEPVLVIRPAMPGNC